MDPSAQRIRLPGHAGVHSSSRRHSGRDGPLGPSRPADPCLSGRRGTGPRKPDCLALGSRRWKPRPIGRPRRLTSARVNPPSTIPTTAERVAPGPLTRALLRIHRACHRACEPERDRDRCVRSKGESSAGRDVGRGRRRGDRAVDGPSRAAETGSYPHDGVVLLPECSVRVLPVVGLAHHGREHHHRQRTPHRGAVRKRLGRPQQLAVRGHRHGTPARPVTRSLSGSGMAPRGIARDR